MPDDTPHTLRELPELSFDNSFVRELPGDPIAANHRRQVLRACYSPVEPTPVAAPQLLAWIPEVAEHVGLPAQPDAATRRSLAEVFAGNRLLPGMQPYAACYGGHQFGNWADQLGDGRAITLGEVVHNGQRWELQLKGAGPTPYSRRGDGRAVLRSSLRELLCSEAMHHLGIPTTRALSLVTTGDQVLRDMLYDGNAAFEPGAIVCRVAPSLLRFGNFELFAARGDHETLRQLADYAIATHFPALEAGAYAAWFTEVCRRSAEMVVGWMRVGFVHGVMNTDNMSILGLTLDYGPYGWLDDYDPDWTPNTTDAPTRRYRFGHQPRVVAWNLVQFANALYPLVGEAGPLEQGIASYRETLTRATLAMLAAKLGLEPLAVDDDPDHPDANAAFVNRGLAVLQAAPTDMTIFYRALAEVPMEADASDEQLLAPLRRAYYLPEEHAELPPEARARTLRWLRELGKRVRADGLDPATRRARMHAANPCYVPRNYLAQLAIDDAERGDLGRLHELLEVLREPYREQAGREHLAARRPDWAKSRPGCSMLSCSS